MRAAVAAGSDWLVGDDATRGCPASAAQCLLRLARSASFVGIFERLKLVRTAVVRTRMPGGVTGKARDGLPMSI